MNSILKDYSIKKGWAVAQINVKSHKTVSAALITAFLVITVPGMVLTATGGHVEGVGFSSLIYSFAIIVPILLATANFNKTMRLGAKKKDCFVGNLMSLLILSSVLSFFGIVFCYGIDKTVTENLAALYSLYTVLGFSINGVFIGFLQQFGFMFLISVLVFLFASIQDTWKGWIADIFIALFFILTITINSLQGIWETVICLTITGQPVLQICFTLFNGFIIYLLYLLILKRKKI